MSTNGTVTTRKQAPPAIANERLPWHPQIEERFGVDRAGWRALVESTFPAAQTAEAVILALSYCRARKLDPFKRVVHIVPIWDKQRRCMVETVWPGIAEYRTTAFRTGVYAGHDATEFGPTISQEWRDDDGIFTVKFPEWAQMTVYRLVGGQRVAFPGPRVYWLETYAKTKSGAPNAMWRNRPHGQIEKCAEAAALRGAFPEEMGGEYTAEEAESFQWHGRPAIDVEAKQGGQYATKTEAVLAHLDAARQDAAEAHHPEPIDDGSQLTDDAGDGVDVPADEPPFDPAPISSAEEYECRIGVATDAGDGGAALRGLKKEIEADVELTADERKMLCSLIVKALPKAK